MQFQLVIDWREEDFLESCDYYSPAFDFPVCSLPSPIPKFPLSKLFRSKGMQRRFINSDEVGTAWKSQKSGSRATTSSSEGGDLFAKLLEIKNEKRQRRLPSLSESQKLD